MSRQKSALVTGASSGIGHATAIELAKRGYQVFAGARRLDPMQDLKDDHGVIIIELDVSSLESVKSAKKLIAEKTGGYLDILYNNAGQSCTFPCTDVTDEWCQQCFEVNVFGPVRTVREFAPLLINAKGTIGFTGSVSGLVPFPFSSIYGATKAAIHQYAASLRIEMKPFGVKVINFITGGVKTNIEDKRDLPSSSYYNIANIESALVERRQMAVRNNPIEPEVYAYQVVNDFEKSNSFHHYRGAKSIFLGFLLYWCPRFIVEWALVRKFKLNEVFTALKEKYSTTKLKTD